MVEEVAERRHGARVGRIVVVRADQRRQRGVALERPANADERIAVNDNVGVDEHEQRARRLRGAAVPSVRRAAAFFDDDDLLGRLIRASDRRQALSEGGRRVRGRHDRAQARHARILGSSWGQTPT